MENWIYDEMKQVGINFENEKEIALYDKRLKENRDFDLEAYIISKHINLKKDSVVLEVGTGTGELAFGLAKFCKKVVACDRSEMLLAYAKKKAKKLKINNIEFIKCGLLSFPYNDRYFDCAVSQMALHHLPDFWKSVAINNIAKALKPGGMFYLFDNILNFEVKDHEAIIPKILKIAKENFGSKILDETIINIRDEYPTYNWIIEGFIENSGFNIKDKMVYNHNISDYVCVKAS